MCFSITIPVPIHLTIVMLLWLLLFHSTYCCCLYNGEAAVRSELHHIENRKLCINILLFLFVKTVNGLKRPTCKVGIIDNIIRKKDLWRLRKFFFHSITTPNNEITLEH